MRRAALALALAACSQAAPVALRVDVPILDQHRSMVVGVEIDRALTVHALSIAQDRTVDPINVRFPLDGEVLVTALLYDQTLDALGLAPGVLSPEEDPAHQQPLPRAERVARLTIGDGQASEWTDGTVPPALEAFRITAPDPCGRLVADTVDLGLAGAPTFALALDDRWVLIGTNTRLLPAEPGKVFFVDRDRSVVEQRGLPSSFFDGYRQDDGIIWLGGEQGVVYRATFTAEPTPALEVTASSTVSSREDIISLVGPASGTPREQFALTTNRAQDEQWGAFEWFDGQRWTVPGLRRNTPHDATWVAPGYGLFASFYRDTEVFGARDGVEVSIRVSSVVLGSVVQIQEFPGYGLVAGTSAGEVHLQPEGDQTWRQIAGFDIEPINGVQRYPEVAPDGLVFLSGSSLFRYLDEGGLLCDPSGLPADGLEAQRSMTVLGADVIVPMVDGALPEDQLVEQRIAWFRRAPL